MVTISLDETHHIRENIPLYKTRYKRVMSFHNGIAPVEIDKASFFIDMENRRLFNRVFIKAYGFYENLSAVKDKDGWFHFTINGDDLYPNRYGWVGNFGENRCVVRDFDNNYFHIDKEGRRVYLKNYNYTGDFKYGIAVVVDKDGYSTHIKSDGALLHGKLFDELNIFHKGFAIAKDNIGYFHIDKKGNELYSQRYKKIENFYNGCAFATTFENAKIVLNEDDLTELQITESKIDKNRILDESFGYFKYQILFAILKLNILNHIEQNQEIDLPEISLKLIYRWLYVENIIDNENSLTKLGKVIEYELKPILLYWQDLPFKTSTYMLESLQSGDESFSKIFQKPYFDFLEDNDEYLKLSQQINSYYTMDYSPLIECLDLTIERVCDVGGGGGILLKQIKEYYPNIKPLVIDKFIDRNIENHLKVDFFKAFKIKGDVFLLSRILHDWSDKKAIIILQNISNNMTENSVLYLFETIVPIQSSIDKGATLSFHLLNFLGGYERTLEEYTQILKQAGLEIEKISFNDELISLIKVKKI
jgi:hypothetical protein